MSRTIKVRAAIAVTLAGAIGVPSLLAPAQAIEAPTVPGAPAEVQDALAQLHGLFGVIPPEVSDAVDPVVDPLVDDTVAEVFSQLIGLDIDGIAQAQSEPGRSEATAVGLDGLTVGRATTTTDSSRVVILEVGGTELLTKEGTPEGGTWGGELAAAGQIVDAVNGGACSAEACLVLVPSSATGPAEGNGTRNAKFALLSLRAGEDGITLLPAEASTTTYNLFGRRCLDFATAFYGTGTGALALVTAVGPKVAIGSTTDRC